MKIPGRKADQDRPAGTAARVGTTTKVLAAVLAGVIAAGVGAIAFLHVTSHGAALATAVPATPRPPAPARDASAPTSTLPRGATRRDPLGQLPAPSSARGAVTAPGAKSHAAKPAAPTTTTTSRPAPATTPPATAPPATTPPATTPPTATPPGTAAAPRPPAPSPAGATASRPSTSTTPPRTSPPTTVAPSPTTTVDPARANFLTGYRAFRRWATKAGPDRVQLTNQVLKIEIDYLVDPTGATERTDCRYAGNDELAWQRTLPKSPYGNLARTYAQMLRNVRALLRACEAEPPTPWRSTTSGVRGMQSYFARLREIASYEGHYLSLDYQQALRYGVAWEWPEAFTTTPQYDLGI